MTSQLLSNKRDCSHMGSVKAASMWCGNVSVAVGTAVSQWQPDRQGYRVGSVDYQYFGLISTFSFTASV